MTAYDDAPNPDLLFRREAAESALRRYGSPVPATGVASWILAAFLVCVFAAAAVFLCTQRYSRQETVIGALAPAAGTPRITAARQGVVADVLVREGDEVHRGQPLVVISTDEMLEGGVRLGRVLDEASTEQSAAQAEQAKSHLTSLQRQREANRAKLAGLQIAEQQLSADIGLQAERVSLQEQSLQSASKLLKQQFFSELAYRQRQEALVAAKQDRLALEKQLADARSSAEELKAVDLQLQAEQAETSAQLRATAAEMDQKRANLQAGRKLVLTSPADGRVAALRAVTGQAVTPSEALAVIMPSGATLQAELWVPSRAIGFARPGDPVRLMYDAYPFQRFGIARGRIATVARAPTPPEELPIRIQTPEALYRITVRLDRQTVAAYGRQWLLSPGERLTADLVLDSRSLLDWLLDPLIAVRRRSQ